MSRPQILYLAAWASAVILVVLYVLADDSMIAKFLILLGVAVIGFTEFSYFRKRRENFYIDAFGHGIANPREYFAQFIEDHPFYWRFFVAWWLGIGFLAIALLTIGQDLMGRLGSMPDVYLLGFLLIVFAPPLVPFVFHFCVKERRFYRSLKDAET